jgi:uncharacterized protein (DUF342 family)
VVVHGDVLTGFRVESLADIVVKGTVEGADLQAQGNILLESGVQGKGEARIQAGGDVIARFLNGAQVRAQGNVLVEGEILHSRIRCNRLSADGQQAEIIGGVIEAARDVCAERFGSEMGVRTCIRLGADRDDLQQEIEQLREQLNLWQTKFEQSVSTLDYFNSLRSEKGELSPEKRQVEATALESHARALEKVTELELALQRALDRAEEILTGMRTVRARHTIYPGVEVEILGKKQTFISPTGPVSIGLLGEELVRDEYQERSFDEEADV